MPNDRPPAPSMTDDAAEQHRRSQRYFRLILVLCIPGLVALALGMPVEHVELSATRSHPAPVGSVLEEAAALSILLTALGGLLFNGGALILFILLLKLKPTPPARKLLAAIVLLLSLGGFIGSCFIVSNMWGPGG
jgi:hypothetical protein